MNWYEKQIEGMSIEVSFETAVSPAFIDQVNPDVVLIATGSSPSAPDLLGIDKANVYTCIGVLLGRKESGGRVVVVGGGMIGCETALWLSQKGKIVTIVEQMPELMLGKPLVPPMNRQMLLDMLALYKVNIITNCGIKEIGDYGLTLDNGGTLSGKIIKADTIVLATGMLPNNEMYYEALKSNVAQVYAIGDCREIRNIHGAVWDGFEVGRRV